MRKMSIKSKAKKTARKAGRTAVRGTVSYVKYMAAYAVMAAFGGFVLATLASYGIELPVDAVAVSAIAYFAVGTLVLHRRLSAGRLIKLGRGLGVIPRKF